MTQNSVELSKLAWMKKKHRRPSGRSKKPQRTIAEVDEYNNRQDMRCIETRRRFNQSDNDTGMPGGTGSTLAKVELAQRTLPRIELAAFMAKEHGTQREQNQLVVEMEIILARAAKRESWQFNGGDEKLRLLASLVVDEWCNPAKFWRTREVGGVLTDSMVVGSFTLIMKCDRKTWHVKWKQYFFRYQGFPEDWYQRGKALM